MRKLLMAPGELGLEGVAGCRTLDDVMSDIRAQIAANNKGASGLLCSHPAIFSLEPCCLVISLDCS